MNSIPPQYIQTADLQIDSSRHSVRRDGQAIALPPLSYKFLLVLVSARGQVVSTDQLAEKVWQKSYVSDETISQRASLLRKALTDNTDRYFEAIRGAGYRWVADVVLLDSLTNVTAPSADSRQMAKVHKALLAVAVVAIIAALLVAYVVQRTPASTAASSKPSQPLSDHDLLLQKAKSYAAQFNAAANPHAIQLFRDVLALDPGSDSAKFGLTVALLHQVSKFNGDPSLLQEAEQLSANLLAAQPDSARRLWLRAFYFDVLGQINQAIALYEQALVQDGHLTEAKGGLAYLYRQKGRLHEALHLNMDIVGTELHYQFLQVAECLALAGLTKQAREWHQRAYQLAPDSAVVIAALARFELTEGKDEAAAKLLTALHNKGMGSAQSYEIAAILALRQQQPQQALALLQQAASLRPESEYTEAWLSWFLRDTQQQQPLQVSVEDWPDLWVYRAISLLASQQRQQAIEALQLAQRSGYLDYRFIQQLPLFHQLDGEAAYQSTLQAMARAADSERAKIEIYVLPKLNGLIVPAK
ncbi:winged helix-turn-helix domain-containing protein [Rheinheimera sp.]|uniref:winged helix-turn-helix domain-containing protein n=1 Tax=Rheinheimera sp. TaxID=1869214 RepID=UPI003AF49234